MGRFPVPLITALVLLASWAALSSRVVTTLNYGRYCDQSAAVEADYRGSQ